MSSATEHGIPQNPYNPHAWIVGEPEIGEETWIGAFTLIDGSGNLRIGKGCNISSGVHILTHSTVQRCITERQHGQVDRMPVEIGDHVFIGENATILMGSKIGHHSIIGAGSVITEQTTIPPHSLVVGVPGRVVRRIHQPEAGAQSLETGSDPAERMLCSVVVPVLNEQDNARSAYETLSSTVDGCGCAMELIFVDDGSTDGTFDILSEIAAEDARVRVIRFTTNFGVHAAISAGFAVAHGDVACIVGADLQEPIGQLSLFLDRIRQGDQVVWGVRNDRQDPIVTRLTSTLFNGLLHRIAGERPYPDGAGFVLVDRCVLDQLQAFTERSRNIYCLIAWMGMRSSVIECPFGARVHGKSRWTLGKKIRLAIDTIASSSYVPIRAASALGLFISLISFVYGAFVLVLALIRGVTVQGWPTMMAAIAFLAGLQLLVVGILGEYLWRVLYESRQRPLYIISQTVGFSGSGDGKLSLALPSDRKTTQRRGPAFGGEA